VAVRDDADRPPFDVADQQPTAVPGQVVGRALTVGDHGQPQVTGGRRVRGARVRLRAPRGGGEAEDEGGDGGQEAERAGHW
jgi:hypothetical protein